MNYLQEIKFFNDWLIINPSVSSDDIVLWYALMNLNNISGWQKEFTVAISTIMDRTRLSRSAIYRSRNKLVQLDRIKTKERAGNQCSIYEVLSFVSQRETHNGTHNGTQNQETEFVSPNRTQPDTQVETQTGTQPETIIKTKLNETKQEEGSKEDKPPAPSIKKDVFKKPELRDLETFFLIELTRLRFPIPDYDNEAKIYADTYLKHYESNGWKVGKNAMKNWKAAVTSWLYRDLKDLKNKKNGTHQQTPNGSTGKQAGATNFLHRGLQKFGAG